jgi:vacuolar-type H+-ATPase subunit E/Vma4
MDLHRKKKAAVAIESLADHVNVDINDPYIKEYVERAVDNEIMKAANKAANDIVEFHKQAIRTAVSAEIKAQKTEMSAKVKKEIETKVGHLDINDIKKEALSEAKEMASEKLREDMDDVLDNYKEGLDNMTAIYKAISEKAVASVSKSIPGLMFDVKL